MAKAYDRTRTRAFVTPGDQKLPLEQRTVFTLRWLSVFDFAAVEEEFAKAGEKSGVFAKVIAVTRRAISGWSNFKMPDGSEAPLARDESGALTAETIAQISPKELLAISANCDEQEFLAPDDVGK